MSPRDVSLTPTRHRRKSAKPCIRDLKKSGERNSSGVVSEGMSANGSAGSNPKPIADTSGGVPNNNRDVLTQRVEFPYFPDVSGITWSMKRALKFL